MLRSSIAAAVLVLVTTACSPCLAEVIPAGVYRGHYHFDRWGQHRFSHLFVSPDLEKTLKPFAGLPLSVYATKVDQPINPGGAMIKAVKDIKKLPTTFTVKIDWVEDDRIFPHRLRRIKEGSVQDVYVTVTNNDDTPLDLTRVNIAINYAYHLPVDRSFHNSYGKFGRDSERSYTVSEHPVRIPPEDRSLHAGLGHVSRIGRPYKYQKVLKKGESHTWFLTLKEIPAREYEVSVSVIRYNHRQRLFGTAYSNVLRLDVLTEKPTRQQGLRVELVRDPKAEKSGDKYHRWQVRFTNGGKRSLRFGLRKAGDRLDFSSELLCYDKNGQRLLPPLLKGRVSHDMRRIEPGKSLVIPIDVPAKTALARFVFYHVVCLQKKDLKPDEDALDNNYIISRHVLVP